jgi:ATPase family associated with various cellular activities (AAA)
MTRIEAPAGSHPEADCAEPGVLAALRRLDRLIQRTLRRLEGAARPDPATDPFRGLHIGPEEIVDLLGSTPGALRLAGVDVDRADVHDEDTEPESGTLSSRLAWLGSAFVLSPFDIDVLLVALAPELDLRYERLYAYLHDDVTRKRPTVDLALNLLCRTPAEKIARRAHFARPAPLIEHALVHLIPDPVQAEPSLLAHYLRLDEQVVRFVLGQPGPDSRLGSIVDLVEPVASAHSDPWLSDASAAITVMARHARDAGQPLRLFFEGTGHGKRRVAEALAGQLGVRVLIATLSRLPTIALDVEKTVTLIFREARFHDAVLFLDGVDALEGDPRAAFVERVLSELARHDGVTILTGPRAWAPARAREPI